MSAFMNDCFSTSIILVWFPLLTCNRLRRSTPELFADVMLYRCLCAAMGIVDFPLAVRRMVHTLFDKVDFSLSSTSATGTAWVREV